MAGVKFYGLAKKASASVSCLTGCIALLKRREKGTKALPKERSKRLKGAPPFHACLPRTCQMEAHWLWGEKSVGLHLAWRAQRPWRGEEAE
jgi:hypothetical protein